MSCYRKIGLFALAWMAIGKQANASEWVDMKGSLVQQIQYNDNMLMSSTQKQPAFGYFLEPSLQLNHKEESFDINFNAMGTIKRYDNSLWDCQNYNVGHKSQYKTGRSVFTLTGSQGISCAYSLETQQTGVVIPAAVANTFNLAPSWTWQWTPRSNLNLTASYMKTTYSGGSVSSTAKTGTTGYHDYDALNINLGFDHAWDRNITLNGGLSFMNNQYMGTNASTQRSIGFQLGGEYLISKHWTANLSGGVRRSELQSNVVSTSSASSKTSLNPIVNLNLKYKGQQDSLSIGYSNIAMPSAVGQTLQTQSVFATYLYQASPHLSFNINGTGLQSLPIGGQSKVGASSSYGRNSFSVTTGFSWQFAKDWQLTGNYTYRWQKLQQLANPGDSNSVMLSLNYSWDGIQY